MKKTLTILLAILLLVSAAACAVKPSPTPVPTAAPTAAATPEPTATSAPTPASPAAVTDFLGNTVTLAAYPKTIVSLSPANTEIVFALGLGDRLVGVDSVSDYPEQAKAIAKVGDFNGPNLEAIAALKPDLVLGGNKLQKDAIDKVKGLGLNVVAAEATTYDDVFKSIEMIGKLTGAEDKASEVVAQMKAKEKAVLDAVAGAGGKTVYYAMTWGESGNWTGGPGSFPYEFVEKCGGKNITEGAPVAWVNLSLEELVAKDPDIILLADDGGDPAAFKTGAGYKDLKAVKNGTVFVVDADLCSRPGPRMADGLRVFAEAITGAKIAFPGE